MGNKCSVDYCDRIRTIKGYCKRHWQQEYRYGVAGYCRIPDCSERFAVKGYCKKHYQESPERKERKRRNQEKYRNSPRWRQYAESPRGRFAMFVGYANQRKWETDLTSEQYNYLINTPCFYCGGALPKYGAALDRLDNTLGYFTWNVVPCCTACNRIRGNNLTVFEMLVAMNAVQEVRKKHGRGPI